MTRQLLDVNVLFALVWQRHEGHSAAHQWFAKSAGRAWATNTLTQLGVLRLLANPVVTQSVVGPAAALEILETIISHPGHEFWPLDSTATDMLKPMGERVLGHQQWTDAVLLGQAIQRGGILVTFDAGLKQLAKREYASHVTLLKLSDGTAATH
jgi:toxin-antitoxin system PIN domain toxin